jgi:hypothetical protein
MDELNSKYNEWLAGIIDGAGCFQLTKKGYACLDIIIDIKDKNCLFQIKNKFGGSIKIKQGYNLLRYRLHHKQGLINLLNNVNGLIQNPNRLLQMSKLCGKYNIILLETKNLTYNNGWLAGFIDVEGSIDLNEKSVQIFITIFQKNKLLLDPLVNLYGGTIYTMSKIQAFKWTIYKKEEILNLINYFKQYPLKSKKMKRILIIEKIYKCFLNSGHKLGENSIYGKIWLKLKYKWDNYK